jgi:dephospho-CoA kinase
MSKATFTFGRFNPPTEAGHGKLVSAVQSHAEESGGKHYIFPSHTQDSRKNPLSHGEKAGALRNLFPNANVVSNSKVKTAIDAMKHLESKGHTHVTMVVGSDRVKEFHTLLNKYRKKEFPGIKKVEVKSAGQRDPDAEGAEGMSASKLRGLVKAGKRDEFVSHYSNKELGASIHDKVKKAMSEETNSPIGIFLLGGPGSGKDYVLKNIFSRFDLVEVQLDQVLSGKASELLESNANIVINGAADADKIELVKTMLEGYEFDTVYVSVTNKVSRARNDERADPLPENKRLEKWYRSEKLSEELDCFVFNNSINLNESSQMEQIMFANQIEKLLERLVERGLALSEKKLPSVAKDKASGLPKKYVAGLSASTAKARASHWREKAKLSDSDPRAYEPAPGDATAKTKPSKYTLKVRKMMDEANEKKIRRIARSGNITAVMNKRKETGRVSEETVDEGAADKSLSAKAAKSGISVSTLRKVYRRGVAAWNSGHRPGTTPSQWGHARVNSYISKGKGTYHGADKDLREDIDQMFEQEMDCCPENYEEAVDLTPTLAKSSKKKKSQTVPPNARDAALDGLPVVTSGSYVREDITLEEAVQYHLENKISFTENAFRPGSEMFFEMISEARRLYSEGNYAPKDEWERDMLNSNIGEIAEFEGQQVVLDYPVEEGLEEACWSGYTQKGLKKKGNRMVPNCVPVNEEDKTDGKGIGKPWREGGGGAVYVRTGDGGVKKVRFSQSGMAKKFNDPGATKSFVARHRCLTNKDKTSASYWACRYPRFFSNSGKIWW